MTATTKYTLAFHPVSEIFPMMDAAELAVMAADIKANGQREAIWLFDGKIIDGRNRYEACKLAGVQPLFQTWEGEPESLVAFVLSLNLHRRHLNESQRAMVAAHLATLEQGEKKADRPIGLSQSEAAESLNVGVRSVRRAQTVQEHAVPEVVKAVEQGKVTVSDAAKIAEEPKATQRAALKAVARGDSTTLSQAVEKAKEPEKAATVERDAVIEAAKEFDALLRLIETTAYKTAEALSTGIAGTHLRHNNKLGEFKNKLKTAGMVLRDTKPYGECPYCDKKNPKCGVCHGSGYVPRHTYENSPRKDK